MLTLTLVGFALIVPAILKIRRIIRDQPAF